MSFTRAAGRTVSRNNIKCCCNKQDKRFIFVLSKDQLLTYNIMINLIFLDRMSEISGSTTSSRRRSVEALPGVEAFLRRRGSTSHIFGPSSMQDLEEYVNKKRRSSMGFSDLADQVKVFREKTNLSLGNRQHSSGPFWDKDVAQGEDPPKETTQTQKHTKRKNNLLDKRWDHWNTVHSILF